MKRILYICLALLSLSSCGLYTKYERPDVRFTDSLYRRLPAETDTNSLAKLKWDELFTDPILQDWIRLGIENNTDLNVARQKVEAARAGLISARRALLPGVSGSISGGTPGTVTIGLDASWEADIFGKLRNTKKSAVAAVEESIAYKQAVQSMLVATIAGYYYNLLMLDEKLKTSRHTLTTWEENIRTLTALKRAGKATEAAVLQAKANKFSVEGSVLTLERQIVEQEEALATAKTIAMAAIKYGDLSNQAAKDYIFDIDRFTSFEGNTGPYILYTIVRIKSILNKYQAKGGDLSSIKNAILSADSEGAKNLMLALAKFNATIEGAYEETAPHKICAYIYELANAFNGFYHDTKILAEENAKVQKSYIALLVLTKSVLETCIDMLGFEAPERM